MDSEPQRIITPAPVLGTGIAQLCYVVADLDEACRRFHEAFGMGPFVGGTPFSLEHHRYCGQPSEPIRLRGAFGWSAGLCIELVEVHSDTPSAFNDMRDGSGATFLHHVATFVDDYAAARERCAQAGYPVVSEFAIPALDVEICYVDTRALCGHMLEIYPENAGVRAMYEQARRISGDWSAGSLIVPWS